MTMGATRERWKVHVSRAAGTAKTMPGNSGAVGAYDPIGRTHGKDKDGTAGPPAFLLAHAVSRCGRILSDMC